ncbi:RNA polymerase sigma-70 factor [Variovorax dokdonensis]|uniref:RNA polymerase sigma-70 factor n=1 Tax=Variovorax dokdonensis TaxID=344883 RepID=A0ABT7NEY7_9BURK|nr:RNA polymerase sigma-70 factor [Variovorax dokdonensis]MDM0046515.1 RNA polymerase sigma-70 factor [Variovorax dokdonensis]
MDDLNKTFARLRPRLQGIAYRMLGTVAEAEEVVQDAWLRWHENDPQDLDSTEAWLVTVTTRLAIDRLRSARAQREHYTGMWLPEPLLDDAPDNPEQMLERADQISVAFLLLLERLSPEARAAYLLKEVFDADYAEVAQAVGKSEAACRQLVHRAKAQLSDERPRRKVSAEVHRKLLEGFAQAIGSGDLKAMRALLSDSAELISDGGGVVIAFPKPLLGGQRIAQLFLAGHRRHGAGMRIEVTRINGQWGALRFIDGVLESAQSFEIEGDRIVRIHVQRNPVKLARIAAAWAA